MDEDEWWILEEVIAERKERQSFPFDQINYIFDTLFPLI